MKRILTIVGARPQFIKAAPVSVALRSYGIEEYSVHTGQHYDESMSQVFFDQLRLRTPDINLGVGSGSHAEQTASMLTGIEAAIKRAKPDAILVYGDTNSTLAGALAAAKLCIPVAHVEAGLRSFNKSMPEEQNRILTDHLSSFLFAPTESAIQNLAREGIASDNVHLVGDVMFDAAQLFAREAEESSTILKQLCIGEKNFILATVHRAANTDDPVRLETCLRGLALAGKHMPVILPLHPRTRTIVTRLGLDNELAATIRIVEPQGYLDMLTLIRAAAVIATDSGGLQKEAFFFKVPCVTLRDETEWVELISAGWNRLCPPKTKEGIEDAVRLSLGSVGADISPYGVGTAAASICAILASQ